MMLTPYFQTKLGTLYNGNCLEVMKEIPDNSIDAVVTDPPYELGFMGKSWDSTGIAYNVAMWGEVLRILKPGGHLLSFGGSRTYHRMACAIEDAGFEIRDQIMWVYGSGFPKSLNIGKAVDKRGGTTSDQSKEFAEYIKTKRTELNISLSKADEVVCGGTTNYSWFEGRPAGQRLPRKTDYLKMKELLNLDDRYDSFMEETERETLGYQRRGNAVNTSFMSGGNDITKGTSEWEGYGTALKPAHEPIVLARKPIEKGMSIVENCLKWGVGGLAIDECWVEFQGEADYKESTGKNQHADFGTKPMTNNNVYGDYSMIQPQNYQPTGRFPANFIHDGSDEVLELFPDSKSTGGINGGKLGNKVFGKFANETIGANAGGLGDSGSAARFFYCAKASKAERDMGCEGLEEQEMPYGSGGGGMPCGNDNPIKMRNNHPTVKPLALMQYLIKLISRDGHTIIDPFTGSGTTAMACEMTGRRWVGIEQTKDYCDIAVERIKAVAEVEKLAVRPEMPLPSEDDDLIG